MFEQRLMRRLLGAASIVVASVGTTALAHEGVSLRGASETEIRDPLTREPGNVERGRAGALSRDANCVLCHVIPGGDPSFAGNIAPPLAGVGRRLSAGQLRLRIVDSMRINASSIMPPYYRVAGLRQVAPALEGKTIFTAQQVEDVVAFLATLRDP
jgi:sulfur-oxidizing protein SoxX